MRLAIVDGEMSNLNMDFGQLLCWGIAEYRPVTAASIVRGKRPWMNVRVLTLEDYDKKRWDDRGLAQAAAREMSQYDVLVTWNGVRFDIPALNSRLGRWGIKEFIPKRHKDLIYSARYKLKLSSASQENVASHRRRAWRIKNRSIIRSKPCRRS